MFIINISNSEPVNIIGQKSLDNYTILFNSEQGVNIISLQYLLLFSGWIYNLNIGFNNVKMTNFLIDYDILLINNCNIVILNLNFYICKIQCIYIKSIFLILMIIILKNVR